MNPVCSESELVAPLLHAQVIGQLTGGGVIGSGMREHVAGNESAGRQHHIAAVAVGIDSDVLWPENEILELVEPTAKQSDVGRIDGAARNQIGVSQRERLVHDVDSGIVQR